MDGIVVRLLRLSQGSEPVSVTEIKTRCEDSGGEACSWALPDRAEHVLYFINHIFVVRNRDYRLGRDKITH